MTPEQTAIIGMAGTIVSLGGAVIRYLVKKCDAQDTTIDRQTRILERLSVLMPELYTKAQQESKAGAE